MSNEEKHTLSRVPKQDNNHLIMEKKEERRLSGDVNFRGLARCDP
jgi:hypothetical protein